MSSALTVEVVSDIRTLVTLEPAWWSLWYRSRNATPFQSPAWLIPWWRSFSPGELFVVVVWREARLLGMAPLYVETFGELRLLPLGISISDYIDVLADTASEDEALRALADFLASCPTPWDTWEMPDAAPEALSLRLPAPRGSDDVVAPSIACPVLALPRDGGGLASAIPARKRRDIRMARHRAERRGGIEVTAVTPATAAETVEELFRLHGARWQSRGQEGVLADPRLRRFHAEAIPKLVRRGIARLYTLAIGDVTAGLYYGLSHADRAHAYLCGFDPAYEYESPGTILLAHAIEEAARERATEFHFLRGRESYKYRWGAVDRWSQHRSFRRRLSRARAS